MRLKGINPIERHAEKLFAGVLALALLGVLAWQFLTPPAKVKVGAREVPIQDAYRDIAEMAAKVDGMVKTTRPELPPEPLVGEITKRIDNFEATLKAPVAPNKQLVRELDKPGGIEGGPGLKLHGTDQAMAEVKIPAPEHAAAATYLATVSSSEAQVPEVAKILPAAAPFDKAAVTVEATFNGAELRKALELDPDGSDGPIRAVPRNWWESGVQILAVELMRETLKPDGTWTAAEKVKGMPGRPVLVDSADTLNDAESLKAAHKLAVEQPDMVRRTPYYMVSMGEEWKAPSERSAQSGAAELNKAGRVKQLRDDLKQKDRQIKTVEDDLAKLGQGGGRPAPGGGGGRPGAGGGGGAAPAAPSSTDDAKRKGLQARLTRLKEERAKIVAELRDLGETVEGEPNTQPTMAADANKPKAETPVLDNSSIRVWAHDVFVERGKTYRYQLSLVLTNPYFGHSAAMKADQADKLAKSGIMRSPASEWTAPVSVDPETYIYFTSATEDDPITGTAASARVEVYQFKWGFWRRSKSAPLEPGDRVVAEIEVPDFSKLIAAAPANPDAPPPPPPGGGRLGQGIPPAPGNAGDATPPVKIPRETVTVVRDEIVLSVGHGPSRASSSGRSPEVFLREANGNVRIIEPEVEKSDAAYVRVSKSADRGERELSPPVEKARPNQPQQPTVPDADRDRRRDDPGGG